MWFLSAPVILFICCAGYIAGFVELEVSNRPDLYDVFVNLADSEITIAPLAKGGFSILFSVPVLAWGANQAALCFVLTP